MYVLQHRTKILKDIHLSKIFNLSHRMLYKIISDLDLM